MALITAVYSSVPQVGWSSCYYNSNINSAEDVSCLNKIKEAANCCSQGFQTTLEKMNVYSDYLRSAYNAMAAFLDFSLISKRFSPKWNDRIQGVLKATEFPVFATKIFYIVDTFYDVPKFIKSVGKVVKREGVKQFDAVLRAVSAAGSFCWNVSSSLYGYSYIVQEFESLSISALSTGAKTVLVVADALWYLSLIGSTADVIISCRRLYKTRQFIKQFTEEAGYKENGVYTKADYDKLINFMNQVPTKALGKKFDIDGAQLKNQINNLLQPLKSRTSLGDKDIKNLKVVMDALMDRLEAKKKGDIIGIFDNAVYLVGSVLMVVVIAQPYLYPVWSACYYSSYAVQYAYCKYSDYVFQDKLGLIQRPPADLQPGKLEACPVIGPCIQKVVDFGKWYLGIYTQKSQSAPVPVAS